MAEQVLRVADGGTNYDIGHEFPDGTRGVRVGMPGGPDGMDTGLTASLIVVGTVATALPTTALANRKHIIVQNQSAATLYLGKSSVSTSGYGLALSQGQSFSIDLGPSVILYGVTSTSGTCGVMEVS